jgi:glycosyltransferase involved in cell wall biosynthesis
MRILMLGPGAAIQGPLPKIVPLLAASLRSLGCVVDVETWGRHCDDESLFDKIAGRLIDVVRIRRALGRQPCEVMVVTTAHDWATLSRDIPLLLATRKLCGCAVLQFHGSFAERFVAPGHSVFKWASRWLIRLSDAALVCSTEEQRQWRALCPGSRFYVVNYPLVSSSLRNQPVDRLQLGLPERVPIVLFVGRLIEAKGVLDVVGALPEVVARTPCHLLIVGDGPLAAEVRRRATAAGIRAHVTVAGYLRGDALRGAFACADVFVLPTRWSEGFPLSIIEALDAGLPIITTSMRGMADHLHDGTNALFVDSHDRTALSNALSRLLTDPELRARMGRANRQKARDFDPEVVARHYLEVLREIVGQPGRSRPAGGRPTTTP